MSINRDDKELSLSQPNVGDLSIHILNVRELILFENFKTLLRKCREGNITYDLLEKKFKNVLDES